MPRAFSSRSFSGLNFTVLQFISLADKSSPLQKIKHRNEQAASPSMKFPLPHKNNHGRSSSYNTSLPASSLTKTMLEATSVPAFDKASEYPEHVRIITILRNNKLPAIIMFARYLKRKFSIISLKTPTWKVTIRLWERESVSHLWDFFVTAIPEMFSSLLRNLWAASLHIFQKFATLAYKCWAFSFSIASALMKDASDSTRKGRIRFHSDQIRRWAFGGITASKRQRINSSWSLGFSLNNIGRKWKASIFAQQFGPSECYTSFSNRRQAERNCSAIAIVFINQIKLSRMIILRVEAGVEW